MSLTAVIMVVLCQGLPACQLMVIPAKREFWQPSHCDSNNFEGWYGSSLLFDQSQCTFGSVSVSGGAVRVLLGSVLGRLSEHRSIV